MRPRSDMRCGPRALVLEAGGAQRHVGPVYAPTTAGTRRWKRETDGGGDVGESVHGGSSFRQGNQETVAINTSSNKCRC